MFSRCFISFLIACSIGAAACQPPQPPVEPPDPTEPMDPKVQSAGGEVPSAEEAP